MRSRPAESFGVAGALSLLIARLLGVDDPDVIVSLAVVIGFLPAAVTWLVERFRPPPPPPAAHLEASPRRR